MKCFSYCFLIFQQCIIMNFDDQTFHRFWGALAGLASVLYTADFWIKSVLRLLSLRIQNSLTLTMNWLNHCIQSWQLRYPRPVYERNHSCCKSARMQVLLKSNPAKASIRKCREIYSRHDDRMSHFRSDQMSELMTFRTIQLLSCLVNRKV